MKTNISRCYACHEPETTREHVPPKSFYPSTSGKRLITVPSCKKHNNANHLDVEYVRNVLLSERHSRLDLVGTLHDKVWRSFDNSPKLLKRTFRDIQPVILYGEQTGYFTLDLARFHSVMSAIAMGMHYHHFKKRFYGTWRVFDTATFFADSVSKSAPEGSNELQTALFGLPFDRVETPDPEIFECGVHFERKTHNVGFRFRFFSGMHVWAIGFQPWQKVI